MKERIIDSAWQQILKYGVKRFTMQDIASDLGISKKTIYAHFAGKEEIIAAVTEMLSNADTASHLKALESGVGFFEKMELLINAHCHKVTPLRFLTDMKRYYPVLLEDYMGQSTSRLIYAQLIKQGIEEGYLRSDIDPAILELILDKSLEGLNDASFLADAGISLQQGMQLMIDILLHGTLRKENTGGGENDES